jgi:hypothetical protein
LNDQITVYEEPLAGYIEDIGQQHFGIEPRRLTAGGGDRGDRALEGIGDGVAAHSCNR